jgi:ABC-2 type transport system ATP-binding protein
VLVTSHLLGELERVSDHVVVLDGGRLLRSSATRDFTGDTGSLLVEVLGEGDAQRRMGEALVAAGVRCRPRGQLIEVDARGGPAPHDLIRDTAVDQGVGLVRVQVEHQRIEDIFRQETDRVDHA